MNNQDYIRHAAELAKWTGKDECGVYVQLPEAPISLYLDDLENHAPPWFKDALAAQLVRQVDALPGLFVYSWPERSSVVVEGRNLNNPETTRGSCDGPDRTMNTIKAIVDSGVLR